MAEKDANVMSGKGSNVHQSVFEEITECCICSEEYKDPRILPCVHTFCLRCLQSTVSNSDKKPGDKLPCPVCRKRFAIPRIGLDGLKKNFFMSRLIELMKVPGHVTPLRGEDMTDRGDKTSDQVEASPVINNCTEELIEGCTGGQIDDITGIRLNSDKTLNSPLLQNICKQHDGEQMRLYCIDCDEVVCVLCFIDDHQCHKCCDVDKAADQFRHQLQRYIDILEDNEEEEMTKTADIADEKRSFLKEVSNVEGLITGRIQQLKDLIDKHAASLLDDLTLIKQNRLKEIDKKLDEMLRHRASLCSFKKHCSELKSQGTSGDICRDFKNLQRSVDDLQKLHIPLIERQMSFLSVSFSLTDVENFLTTESDASNVVGKIEETTLEKVCIVIGSCDGMNITNQVTMISLEDVTDGPSSERVRHRHLPPLPTPHMQPEAAAAVKEDDNCIYVVGVGEKQDEIWKYDFGSGWTVCHSLIQWRARHCVNFVGSTLYVCGGSADENVLCSVEGYDSLTNTCTKVGDLVSGVECSTCVNYKGLIYVFGGDQDNGDSTSDVQVYNVVSNSCVVLSRSMPRPQSLLRAAVWKSFAILIGPVDSYLYDFEAQIFHERNQFQTGLVHFGVILKDERIFVVGGGVDKQDASGKVTWNCTSEVRSISVRSFVKDIPQDWRVQAQLPRSAFVEAYVGLRLPSNWI